MTAPKSRRCRQGWAVPNPSPFFRRALKSPTFGGELSHLFTIVPTRLLIATGSRFFRRSRTGRLTTFVPISTNRPLALDMRGLSVALRNCQQR